MKREMASAKTSIDAVELGAFIDGPKYAAVKQEVFSYAASKPAIYHLAVEGSKEERRALTLAAIQDFANRGTMTMKALEEDTHSFYHQLWACCYLGGDFGTKLGLQYHFWCGTLRSIGTPEQFARFRPELDFMQHMGCFAITELSHGSNVRAIQTTATYDSATSEFVINTPNDMAKKWWIGAAGQAKSCLCFAQLIVDGKNQGVHVFVVPLRQNNFDEKTLPGITIGDVGHKLVRTRG